MFPVETTLSDTRAAVFGIKACYFALYGCNGMVESLVSVGIAIDLSAEPYWLYVKSYCLAMIRRNDRPLYGSPNVEEIKLLENALRRSNDLLYVIVTANRLLETAKILRRVYYDTNQWETIAILVDKLYYKSGCMFTCVLFSLYSFHIIFIIIYLLSTREKIPPFRTIPPVRLRTQTNCKCYRVFHETHDKFNQF